jgi:hypothetical protein
MSAGARSGAPPSSPGSTTTAGRRFASTTWASHLIIDLGLDARVSRMLGHARITITLDVYTHLFEDARHGRDIRTRMAASPFAGLLEPNAATSGAGCVGSDSTPRAVQESWRGRDSRVHLWWVRRGHPGRRSILAR